ncbi:MAG TPA: electron transport complex subunit E [Spirochaetota bacterium]|nr:electron transport complex subunit E [Spirochaetota bacterium]
MNKIIKEFNKGIIKENPIFVLLLGMCPTLGVTGTAANGLGMGLATMAVLIGSNIVISILKRVIPAKVRIPAFIIIIASFVTVIDLSLNAYFPVLYEKLGIFIPLIVVNCLILGRAEGYASKNSLFMSIIDAAGMGCGFTIALTLLGSFREILGSGSFFSMQFVPEGSPTFLFFVLPGGAFIALGILIALFNKMQQLSRE